MSKTKSLKKKTTGFDILYRVVTALLAVAMYPVFYFGNLLTIEIAHTDISDFLNMFGCEKTLQTTYESISLHKLPQLIETISSFTNGESFDFKEVILQNELYRPVVVAVVFIAIALVIGLVVLGFAIFSNKVKVIAGLSATGFLCTVAAYISFTPFFASKLLSGEISLAELLSIDGIIIPALLELVGEVVVFTLDSAFFGILFLLLAICLWSISVMIVNAGDEKENQMKKASKNK